MSKDRWPSVSVVVPARNAADVLPDAIDSILTQDYPGEVEVVVAIPPDDGPTRAAGAIDGVRIVDNPDGTTPAALNAAIAASTGEVVARCDAQARLPEGYLRRAVETLIATGAANVGGVQRAVGSTPLQRAIAVAQSTPVGVGDARYRLSGEAGPTDTVYLGVFRREALAQVGSFDPTLERNQDYELNWRLREAGETVWFDPELVVDYTPRSSLGALWRQYHDYGRWKRRVVARHPASLRWRQLAPPALVVALAASPLAGAVSRRGFIAGAVPAAYLAGLAGTGISEAIRRREPWALASPAPLAVMHLAWGLGFLRGQPVPR